MEARILSWRKAGTAKPASSDRATFDLGPAPPSSRGLENGEGRVREPVFVGGGELLDVLEEEEEGPAEAPAALVPLLEQPLLVLAVPHILKSQLRLSLLPTPVSDEYGL